MFSFKRLAGADPTLGVEMASTGEVACYGKSVEGALLNALLATLNFKLPTQKRVLVSIQEKLREDFEPSLRQMADMGYEILATEETAAYIERLGLKATRVRWAGEVSTSLNKGPVVDDVLKQKKVDFCLMFSNQSSKKTEVNYQIRRLAVDFGVPLFTDIHVAIALTNALKQVNDGKVVLETRPMSAIYADEAIARSKEKRF
jgi:hypothetical protein